MGFNSGLKGLKSPLHNATIASMLRAPVGSLFQKFGFFMDCPRIQLPPRNEFLPEKLTGPQLTKNFPAFCGIRNFITAFTTAHHRSLFTATSIQSMPSQPTSLRSIVILSSCVRRRLPSDLSTSGFPTKTLYTPLLSSIHAICPIHIVFLDLISQIICV